jgi:type III secretory pathway component EscS
MRFSWKLLLVLIVLLLLKPPTGKDLMPFTHLLEAFWKNYAFTKGMLPNGG